MCRARRADSGYRRPRLHAVRLEHARRVLRHVAGQDWPLQPSRCQSLVVVICWQQEAVRQRTSASGSQNGSESGLVYSGLLSVWIEICGQPDLMTSNGS